MIDLAKHYYDTLEEKRGELSIRKFLLDECGLMENELTYFWKHRKRNALPFVNVLAKTLDVFEDEMAVRLLESSMRTNEKISPQVEKAYETYYKEKPHLVPIRRKIRKAHRELVIAEAMRGDRT